MLTANCRTELQAGNALALFAIMKRISGGSRETDPKEPIVAAMRSPAWLAVTTDTPVANMAKAFRKSRSEKVTVVRFWAAEAGWIDTG
jgi:hypothetical protein